MRRLYWVAIVALLASCAQHTPPTAANLAGAAPSSDIPYRLTLSGFTIDGVPGLHSYVMAGTANQLVIFGGRLNGLHGFPPNQGAPTQPAFPSNFANDAIYVFDLTQKKLLGKSSVADLPGPIADQMKANNAQYKLVDGWLYVVGGYSSSQFATLGTAMAIDFNALVGAVTSGRPLNASFATANIAQAAHPALAVSGGNLALLGNRFLLAFGHQFNGQYTPQGSIAGQTYSDSIRVFTLKATRTAGKATLTVGYLDSLPPLGVSVDPESPYHRRDLTMRDTLNPSGQPRITAFGGVFKGGRMEGHLNPMYIDPASAAPGIVATVDTATSQLLSQYDGAAIVFADKSNTIYTTFFGGISYYYWDGQSKRLKHDNPLIDQGIDGLPFINSVSTLKQPPSGPGRQYLHVNETFPPVQEAPFCPGTPRPVRAMFLGAETGFAPAPGIPATPHGVILLSNVTGPIVIGYLVGGIAATAPYSSRGSTCASPMFYQVTVTPGQATQSLMLSDPSDPGA